MKAKKNLSKMPKPRHGWAINPKTRITPSKKHSDRKDTQKFGKYWVDELLG